jgi:DNA excision repair protein ERCC-2
MPDGGPPPTVSDAAGDPSADTDADPETEASGRTVAREAVDADWVDWFPFDPYPQQVEGVEEALDLARDGGYLLLEGACGTGKTLIALAAGLQAVREEHADRVMAVTPVKQQLRQFVTEVRAINDTREERVDGLVMVGKRDLLPYAREDGLPGVEDVGVQESSSDMRERTAKLVSRESGYELDVPHGALDGRVGTCAERDCDRRAYAESRCAEHREGGDPETPWYDPVRAAALCGLVAEMDGPRLETAGAEAPYPAEPPHLRDVLDLEDSEGMAAGRSGYFDPFFARFLADEQRVPFGFEAGEAGVLDAERLVRAAVGHGTCPHECLAALMGTADVLVGNYNHAFDPVTRRLTGEKAGVLDDGTYLVVDEAHTLEDRVRDLLSETLSLYAVRTARRDVTLAREYLAGTGGEPGADPRAHQRDARSVLNEFPSVAAEDLERMGAFLDWLIDAIDEEVDGYLDGEFGGWKRRLREGTLPEDDHEIPLRDPESVDPDRLSEAAAERFPPDVWELLRDAGFVAAEIHDNDGQTDRTPTVGAAGQFLASWGTADRGTYFREIELEYSEKPREDTSLPDWTAAYNASLSLYNCIPREPLARTFDDLAGGVLMSATLEPMDVYRRVSGLDALAEDREDDDGPPRRVETARYGLAFPEENRASWVVDLPAFTYRNRGPPETAYDAMSRTRQAYATAMTTVARSEGNVLLCLPSYAEAEWAVDWLRDRVDKPVLRDRSTEARETEAMLERFFQRDGVARVLVTSARGTVTEGVDYHGSRLHTAAVVGVPYANTNAPRMKAVMNAYDRELDGEGFQYAVQVPAVRKARQAFGRVLRGHDEVGTRILLDERYAPEAPRSVADALAPDEREEFRTVSPDMLELALERFWD